MSTSHDADVIVVGAGFAGLAAADALVRAGRSVVVVEARERVGGRVETLHLADGTPIDIGAQWLGPTQDRMYALARRFGRATYPMHVAGKNVLRLRGKNGSYRGHIPFRVAPWTLANLGWAMARLEVMARRVPLEAPWTTPNAASLDQRTLGDWVRANVPARDAESIVRVGIESVFAADPDEISLLHALFYLRSGGGFDALTSSEGGAQQDRVTGGIMALAEGLAAEVVGAGGALRLGAPARVIAQDAEGVRVELDGGAVSASRVIVTLPPPLAAELEFAPALSSERAELLRALPMGCVIKCVASYDEPFWRAAGFSGAAVSDEGPVHVTFDASPASGRPGVLLGFVEGVAARELASWAPERRRAVVLERFAALHGERAARPVEYVDRAWISEPWSRGCYAAVFPPGVWTTVGHTIRRPEGRVHWAGTETASVWNGYVEGAVASGERAAAEVLSA